MKKIATILASAALLAGVTGCESFLEEESYGSTTDIFNEENGLKALVAVEPLLQGAGQHQHVHGDHRYDALCQ